MSFLLDTNVVSELRRGRRANANVHAWALTAPTLHFYLSVITVLEIEIGIRRLARRDAAQAAHLRRWFGRTLIEFQGRVLPIDLEVARQCAELHVPDPRPDRDALIAATALVRGLTLVTRNEVDFEVPALRILNPWRQGT